MKFLLYAKIGAADVKQSLGLPEYSYYFVYKEFKPVFELFGEVVSVGSEEDIKQQYTLAENEGEKCVAVFFCPPHVAPDIYPIPSFCVLAWEFDTIPCEPWGDDIRNDWRYVLNRQIGLICLSAYTKTAIGNVMGEGFLVEDIPVPVWDRFASFPYFDRTKKPLESSRIKVDGSVIDSRNYEVSADVFKYKHDRPLLKVKSLRGERIEFDFTHDSLDSAYLVGFYAAEYWGVWSRLEQPWMALPVVVDGEFELVLKTRGFGPTVGSDVLVTIGDKAQSFKLSADLEVHKLCFSDVSPSSLIRFSGLDISGHGYELDPRTMALGLESMSIERPVASVSVVDLDSVELREVDLGDVVYTTVFNPVDARKNWEHIVSAFCYAFKNCSEATLLLKVTHQHVTSVMGRLHVLLQRIGCVECRVIAIHGFLPDDNFNELIAGTDFYVNASTAEGLCLPMMEFMACGVPSIAPRHTAMVDYLDKEYAFLVSSSLEMAAWPHDPMQRQKAKSYRITWQSLVEQFEESYRCISDDEEKYQRMSERSRLAIQQFSSFDRIKTKVRDFLSDVTI